MNDLTDIAQLITNGLLEYLFYHKSKKINIDYIIENNTLTLTSVSSTPTKPNDLDEFNSLINKKVDKEIDLYYSELLNTSSGKTVDFNLISSIADSDKFEYDQENKKLFIEIKRKFKLKKKGNVA